MDGLLHIVVKQIIHMVICIFLGKKKNSYLIIIKKIDSILSYNSNEMSKEFKECNRYVKPSKY